MLQEAAGQFETSRFRVDGAICVLEEHLRCLTSEAEREATVRSLERLRTEAGRLAQGMVYPIDHDMNHGNPLRGLQSE